MGLGVFPSDRSVFLWFTTAHCYLETMLFSAEFFKEFCGKTL